MDRDEIDEALFTLYAYGAGEGVSATQFFRLLQERIALAYLIMSEFDDELADLPTEHDTVH